AKVDVIKAEAEIEMIDRFGEKKTSLLLKISLSLHNSVNFVNSDNPF
ncbi:11634_t:CDS:1, partial [Dentiscutata erythropus]